MINPDLNTQKASTFCYDVTDLMGWRLPYLTGIQRTLVFMLNGFHELGVKPELVWFNPKSFSFESIKVTDLPLVIRRYISVTKEAAKVEESQQGNLLKKRKRDKIRQIASEDPITKAFYESILEFIIAGEKLTRNSITWISSRLKDSGKERHAYPSTCGFPIPLMNTNRSGNVVLISLSASWGIEGHNEALLALKNQGYIIIRMIYDMIPTLKPHYVTLDESNQFLVWVNEIFRHSHVILAISEYTKKEIYRFCNQQNLALPEVQVVRLGDIIEEADSHNSSGVLMSKPPRFVPKRPFFIFVCTFHVRKNQRLAYDAWRIMLEQDREQCPELVFIGLPHPIVANLIDEIQHDPDVKGYVHLLSDITDQELEWYYKHCVATIYPSYYEGWGLPVAESLTYGKVCIASNATSIPEISDLPVFIDPFNVYDLVENVQRCMIDKEWLREKEDHIKKYFVPTRWTVTCQQTLDHLNNALLKIS